MVSFEADGLRVLHLFLGYFSGYTSYSIIPFTDKEGRRLDKPAEKIAQLASMASKFQLADVADLFDWYEPRIRNSFAHSNYQFHEDRYNIVGGRGVVAEGVLTPSLSIEREILPRINGALRFFTAFYKMRYRARASYTKNVVIRGRMGPNETYEDIELLTQPEGGLIGFRTPPQAVAKEG